MTKKNLTPAEEGIEAAKRETEAARMSREELIKFFHELLGPHADPDLEKMSLEDLRASYTNLELEEKEPTKEVIGFLGKPRQVTEADFVRLWVSQITECYNLTLTREDFEELDKMKASIEAMARRKWAVMR